MPVNLSELARIYAPPQESSRLPDTPETYTDREWVELHMAALGRSRQTGEGVLKTLWQQTGIPSTLAAYIPAYRRRVMDKLRVQEREYRARLAVNPYVGETAIGLGEKISKTAISEKLPFSPTRAWRSGRLYFAAKRIERGEYLSEADRLADESLLLDYLDALQEREGRGETFWAQVYEGASEMPAWMVEFWATASLAGIGKRAAAGAGAKLAGTFAEKSVARGLTIGLSKVAGTVAGAGLRSFAMPHRIAESGFRRMMPAAYEFTPEGRLIVESARDKPATAFMKAYAEVLISTFTEETGEAMTTGAKAALSRIPGAKPFFSRVSAQLAKIAPPAAIQRAITRAGYSNLLGEMGEERLEDILLAATGLDGQDLDKTTLFERLIEAVPNGEQLLVEAAVLSIPGAGRTGIGIAANSFSRSNIGPDGVLKIVPEPPAPEAQPEAGGPALPQEQVAKPEPKPAPEPPKIIDPITGVDLTPLTQIKATYGSFGANLKRLFTRHTDLESEVRAALIEHEEQFLHLPKVSAQRSVELFSGLSAADRRALQLSLDDPATYPLDSLPAKLQAIADQINRDSEAALKVHQSLGHLTDGGWPGGRVKWLEAELDKLYARSADYKQEKIFEQAQNELQEQIRRIQDEIERLKGLGYVHRITRQPNLVARVYNRIIGRQRSKSLSTRPKDLLGQRIFYTIEEAEEAGHEVADIAVSHADMLAKTWIAQANANLIEAITMNREIALPSDQAPKDWVALDPRIFPASRDIRYAPPIADAILEMSVSPAKHVLARVYDKFNTAFKLVGFYNPLIMTKNDLFQGWRASGLKFLFNIPKAVKIWIEKGDAYETVRKRGLFGSILDLNPAATELVEDILDEVEASKGKKVRKWLSRYVHPLHPVEDIQRINRITTWNIDEILRIACDLSLQDGRFAKHFGMTPFEITDLANDFMANYGKVPKQTRQVLNRFFFTPTYRISMKRVLLKMYAQPAKFWPQLLRHYGYKLFVWYVLPGLTGLWVAGRWSAGRPERGYRVVLKGVYPGREVVISLSDPLLEEAKLTGQPILQHLEYQMSAAWNFGMNLFRGPRWQHEQDLYGHLFKLGTPFWRDIKLLLDEDAPTAQKILQPLGIAFIYMRRAEKGDEENAARELARALSLWGNAKEQIADLRRKRLIPLEKSR